MNNVFSDKLPHFYFTLYGTILTIPLFVSIQHGLGHQEELASRSKIPYCDGPETWMCNALKPPFKSQATLCTDAAARILHSDLL